MKGKNYILMKRELGVGLVEIMLALVISLILMAGVGQIYISSKASYTMTESLSRMQESARFAMDVVSRSIRGAGYSPCKLSGNTLNTVNPGAGNTVGDFFQSGIDGYDGGNSTFPSSMPATGTDAGDRVAGSDAFTISTGGAEDGWTVAQHNANAAQFKFAAGTSHDIVSGEIMMVCDPAQASIFQVSNANQSNVTIVHNTGNSVSPGNCTKQLGGTGSCGSITSSNYTFGSGSQIVRLTSSGYFLGVSEFGDSNALYEVNTAGVATELVDGIESMQITFAEDTNGDGYGEEYRKAHEVTDWNNVVALRIGLLMATNEEVSIFEDTDTYIVAGESIGLTGGSVTHAKDKKLRYVFNSTVTIRNRGDI